MVAKGHNYGKCIKCGTEHIHPSLGNPEQWKARIGAALQGKSKHWNNKDRLSYTRSPETRAKISVARLGKFSFNLHKRILPRALTDVERAWLACAIDTDGSLGFNRRHYERHDGGYEYHGWQFDVSFYNSEMAFLEHVSQLVDEPVRLQNKTRDPSHYGSKPMYRVQVKAQLKVHQLLKLLLPYLIIKKEKASLAIFNIEQRYQIADITYGSIRHPRLLPSARAHG